jgi:hypothetical protein
MESYYSAREACHLSKCVTHPYLDWDFFAQSNEYCISLKLVSLFCVDETDSGMLGSMNSQLRDEMSLTLCFVCSQSVHVDQNGMCEWGVFGSKVVSDFHLLFQEKKSHQMLLHYIWKLHETII